MVDGDIISGAHNTNSYYGLLIILSHDGDILNHNSGVVGVLQRVTGVPLETVSPKVHPLGGYSIKCGNPSAFPNLPQD